VRPSFRRPTRPLSHYFASLESPVCSEPLHGEERTDHGLALSVPILATLLSRFGALDPELDGPRELVVLWALFGLGGIAIAHHHLVCRQIDKLGSRIGCDSPIRLGSLRPYVSLGVAP